MRLEALEALAKLFNNLWFEQSKRDITDSKVQAYLLVFEDAFPHLNHVLEFVRKSADVLTDGSPDREHWSRLQGEFESLRLLLGEEQVQHRPGPPARRQSRPVADTEVTDREKEALGAVDQGDIDALFVEATTEPAPAVDPAPNDIDTLFVEAGSPAAETGSSSASTGGRYGARTINPRNGLGTRNGADGGALHHTRQCGGRGGEHGRGRALSGNRKELSVGLPGVEPGRQPTA